MRVFKGKNIVFSLKLDDNLYSLAQTVNKNASMIQFFTIFKNKDEWEGIDLNKIDTLFCVYSGNVVMQKLGVRKILEKEVQPRIGGFKHYLIESGDNSEGYRLRDEFMWRGGRLVNIDEDMETSSYYAPTVIEDLTVQEHLDEILKYEFTNMYGDVGVKDRLIKFYKTGINIELMKEKVFPKLDNTEVIPKSKITDLTILDYTKVIPPSKTTDLRVQVNKNKKENNQILNNKTMKEYSFLKEMYEDKYFPDFLVNKGKKILINLCKSIENNNIKKLNDLYKLTHKATEEFNILNEEFEKNDSEIETVARGCISTNFEDIAKNYGFAVDIEELVATRDW